MALIRLNSQSAPANTFGGGKVLQVVSTDLTSVLSVAFSSTSTFVDMTGVSATITPSSASSKILVLLSVSFSCSTTNTSHFRLMRDSTAIRIGDAGASNQIRSSVGLRNAQTPYAYYSDSFAITTVDSPATTSAVTYKLQGTAGASYIGNIYLNRSTTDTNFDYPSRGSTNITVMEIEG